MTENTSKKTNRLPKDFRDILINESNDDVIIPISTTFDKAVLHIGIRNRRDIRIEKPDVKQKKDAISSFEYATRALSEKPDSKEINEKNRKRGKVDRHSLVKARSAKTQKQTGGDKQLPSFHSSLGRRLQFELLDIKSAAETVSEAKPLIDAKSEHAKGDIDVVKESRESSTVSEFINVSLSETLSDPKQKDMVFEMLNAVNPCQASTETNIKNDVEISDTTAAKLYASSFYQISALGIYSPESKLRETDTSNKDGLQNMLTNVTAHTTEVLKLTETRLPDQVALFSAQSDDTNLEEVPAMYKRGSRVDAKNITVSPQIEERLKEEMFSGQSDIIKDALIQKQNKISISDDVLLYEECVTKVHVVESHEHTDIELDAIRPMGSTSRLPQSCNGEEDMPQHGIVPFEKYVIVTIGTEDKPTETSHRDKDYISEVVTIELTDFKSFVTTPGYQNISAKEALSKVNSEFEASEEKPCYQSEVEEIGNTVKDIEAGALEIQPNYQFHESEKYKTQLESKVRTSETTISYQHDTTEDEITKAQNEVKDSEQMSLYQSDSIQSDGTNVESDFTESDKSVSCQFASAEDDASHNECEARALGRTSRLLSDDKEFEATHTVTVTQSEDLSDYVDVAALMEIEARASGTTPTDSDHVGTTAHFIPHMLYVTGAYVTEHLNQSGISDDNMTPMKNDLMLDESSLDLSASLNFATDIENAIRANESENGDQLENAESDSLGNECRASLSETMTVFQWAAADDVVQVENENRVSQMMSIGQSDEAAAEINTRTEEAVRTPNNLHNEEVEVALAEIVATALLEAQRRVDNTIPANVGITNAVINRSDDVNDGVFGIMNIYTESDLHCDVNNTDTTEASTDTTDFGYIFFSLTNFFS